jgi:hypothetical protein
MDLPKQKDFYDNRRQFQGKDNPTDTHPDSTGREPMPLGQIAFGLVFLLFVVALFWMRIHSEPAPTPAQILGPAAPAAPAPAPAKR